MHVLSIIMPMFAMPLGECDNFSLSSSRLGHRSTCEYMVAHTCRNESAIFFISLSIFLSFFKFSPTVSEVHWFIKNLLQKCLAAQEKASIFRKMYILRPTHLNVYLVCL